MLRITLYYRAKDVRLDMDRLLWVGGFGADDGQTDDPTLFGIWPSYINTTTTGTDNNNNNSSSYCKRNLQKETSQNVKGKHNKWVCEVVGFSVKWIMNDLHSPGKW